jgi:hypothetical protein
VLTVPNPVKFIDRLLLPFPVPPALPAPLKPDAKLPPLPPFPPPEVPTMLFAKLPLAALFATALPPVPATLFVLFPELPLPPRPEDIVLPAMSIVENPAAPATVNV